MNWKMVSSCIGAALCLLTLLALAILIRGNAQDAYLNLALLVLAWVIGWVLGTLAAPYTKKEESQFTVYAKAVSVFVSGYLVGKLDHLATDVFSPEVLMKPLAAFRLAAFVATALLAALVTRSFRTYS